MLFDVLGLGRFELLEAFAIPIEYVQSMAHLPEPEIEVSNVPGKLMPVQRGESRALIGNQSSDFGRV
jgi:hypothetical protein